MDKLQAKSALDTDYQTGVFGAAGENQPILLSERRGLTMYSLVVWDDSAVNSLLASTLKLSLPAAGQSSVNENAALLWTGPDRYLIVATAADIASQLSTLNDEQGALQDMSCARTVIRIQGDACRHMMAKGLTANISTDSFNSGEVILSSFDHHYSALVHNISGDTDAFDIYLTRSFALSFWHWLCDSSLEFGYQVLDVEHNG